MEGEKQFVMEAGSLNRWLQYVQLYSTPNCNQKMFFSEWNTMTLWEMGFGLFLRIRWEYLYCSFISMVSMKLQPVGDKHTVC